MSFFSEGPGDGNGSDASESSNIGIIVAGTIVGFVLLVVLVLVRLMVAWKYAIEPACSREAQVWLLLYVLITFGINYIKP